MGSDLEAVQLETLPPAYPTLPNVPAARGRTNCDVVSSHLIRSARPAVSNIPIAGLYKIQNMTWCWGLYKLLVHDVMPHYENSTSLLLLSVAVLITIGCRSEERRVGKEC